MFNQLLNNFDITSCLNIARQLFVDEVEGTQQEHFGYLDRRFFVVLSEKDVERNPSLAVLERIDTFVLKTFKTFAFSFDSEGGNDNRVDIKCRGTIDGSVYLRDEKRGDVVSVEVKTMCVFLPL